MISDKIRIHQPTLSEICDYGEQEYYAMVSNLTAAGADLKWQLDEIGLDYTQISDFQLFYSMLVPSFTKERTKILFGELDFNSFQLFVRKESDCSSESEEEDSTGEIIMYDQTNDIVIDESIYQCIAEGLRNIHGMKRNDQKPANESTRRILIQDAKDEYLKNKQKPYHSTLKNLISAMINSEGFKFSHETVWNMKINAFMDSVRRITKIKNADLLMQSGYSGFGINLKTIKKEELDWTADLN